MTLAPQQKLGKLTLLERLKVSGRSSWKCKCDCGKTKTIRQDHLVGGYSRSCGCDSIAAHHRAISYALQPGGA